MTDKPTDSSRSISARLTAGALYLVSLLPFPLLYLVSDALYLVLVHVVRYRRDVVNRNLENAFPEKTDAERKEIARKFFRFLSDQIVESIKMRTISPEQMRKRFVLNNVDELRRHFAKGKAVFAATGHYGNWEWGTLIITLTISEPVIVIYKPLANKSFEELMNAMRARFGAVLVSMKRTMRKIVEYKNRTYLAVVVSDQTPVAGETQYFTSFLNQPTAVFLGVEKLAHLTGNPVVYCHINRLKRGHYECTFRTLVDDPSQCREYEITELHTRELERIIHQRPELWLWSHRRWKFKPEDIGR